MRNSQGMTLLFLAVAVILFLFSLTLLPAVELYCRFQRPALVLLMLQTISLALCIRSWSRPTDRGLLVGTLVFTALGILFNAVVLVSTRGWC